MTKSHTPLVGPPPAEVPLAHPPLIRVIAQVRFPLIASVERRDFIAPFQESIRGDYPVLRQEQNRGIVLGSPGAVDERSNTIWRFHDTSGMWHVTLASDFLALETTKYISRDDFLARFRSLLQHLKDHVDPQVVDRLGMRYIDRVVMANLIETLPGLVRPEVAGILSTPLAEHVKHAISENVFVLPDGTGTVTARWGLVPPHGTVDPGAINAINEVSWLLDVDAFQSDNHSEPQAFEVDALIERANRFAERIYSMFRWAVTDEFLRLYGGKP